MNQSFDFLLEKINELQTAIKSLGIENRQMEEVIRNQERRIKALELENRFTVWRDDPNTGGMI